MEKRRVLLIAGGGTLGSYAALELLRQGCKVDVIALEELVSYNRDLKYICARVDDELLKKLFAENHYDAIVDFIHYRDAEAYESRGRLLMDNTDHLVFLSSYRVYADEEIPLRESSPQLIDVSTDEYFLANEDYAIPKSKVERFLRGSGYKNWTIVRPLISFSHFRLDLVTLGASTLLSRAGQHKKILLPEEARHQTAGLVWAGNTGKMIARLALNSETFCEDYIIGSGENLTWQQVADIYTELIGAEFEWVSARDYVECVNKNSFLGRCMLYCDRIYNRFIDNSKVLAATGLTNAELPTIRDGLIHELDVLAQRPDLIARFEAAGGEIGKRMDEYLEKHGL